MEDIADALVAFLKDAENWTPPPSIAFTVEKDATPDAKLEKENLRKSKVFVVPAEEPQRTRISRGGKYLETYQCYLIFARAMDNDFTRPKLAKWSREVVVPVRQMRMAGLPCVGVDTTVKLNTPLARENDVFVSGVLLSYAGIQ